MFSRSSKTFLLVPFVLAACAHPDTDAVRETVDAPLVTVQRTSMPLLHSVAGTVRPETTSTLAANVVGTVVRVAVAEGDRVRKGDVLVQIDAREPRARLDRTRAGGDELERAIEAATANAQLAETTYERYAALHERGSASRQEYDEANARHTAARAELNRLIAKRAEVRAATTEAETALDFSSVRAPVDGVVSARLVDPGAQAAPGVPLVTIESEKAVRVDASVPEHVTVRTGDRATVTARERRIAARVVRVQPSLDASARSALVKLQLEEPLRAGTYVKVAFAIGTRDVVTVPLDALVRRGQLTSVFVVAADGVARMRLVTLGATGDGQAEVLSGLTAGERIVAAPARVRDGVVLRRTA